MRIGTWNVNSLRVRQPHLIRWLQQSDTDVVCLQETKLTDDKFPADALRDAGYTHLAWHGQPTYNGVAIVSRLPLSDVQIGMGDDVDDPQARVIAATIEGIREPDGSLHAVQQAFVDKGAAQCGFCTPGFVMSAVALFGERDDPTTEEIKQGICGNLCRCTTYYPIVAALESIGKVDP